MPAPTTVRERLEAAGARPRHVELLLRAWLGGRAIDADCAEPSSPFSRALLSALPEFARSIEGMARVASSHPSTDGSERLLIALADGRAVESVLLARGSLCVSTQVGCAVGCVFCKSGEDGLERNLGADEILAQVALARRRRAVRRVVFMGMGEPSQNLAAVLAAISALGSSGRIAHKDLVVSTVGDRRGFERLAQNDVKPALAISLHTTDGELRARLLPRAPRIEPRELIELAQRYGDRTGHPIQYQWTLLAGINDGPEEFERLAQWLRGAHAIVNVIPYNEVAGRPFERPATDCTVEIVRGLKRAGVRATIRRSGGGDVDGACGQLRARSRRLSLEPTAATMDAESVRFGARESRNGESSSRG
jgi:23S rRNA (adenine2503-C2)-methyltransferase